MATVCARPATIASRNSATPPPQLSLNTSSRGTPAAVPNKHLPVCSPGPQPLSQETITPPASPPSPTLVIEHSSPLYPPNAYSKVKDDPPVYAINGEDLHSALDHIASQPLPEPKQVFPWLHGLHPENSLQLAFFIARRKTLRRTPKCIRGLTIVKAGGDLNHSKIKGALAPEEFLLTSKTSSEVAHFMDMDPKDGFSVRNFQIQACKMATVSDVVVYGDERTPREEVKKLAQRIASAQRAWRHKVEKGAEGTGEKPEFNTFILQGEQSSCATDLGPRD
ncbi:tyrosine/serine/threonine protein phosphatase pps1 [Zalaria obscura]|uniref:Tyrosine/serine/threonine protein phosphatase pps1 n=1 Tax=Zalaria obscura TaxID=2024903 RepID=A0ACC3SDL2_9PEZI